MNFKRISVATKLWFSIGIVILSIVIIAAIGLVRSAKFLEEGHASNITSSELVKASAQWRD